MCPSVSLYICAYVYGMGCVSADVPACAQMSVKAHEIKDSYLIAQVERLSNREGIQPARDPLGSQWRSGKWNVHLHGSIWVHQQIPKCPKLGLLKLKYNSQSHIY